jgi:hypothetical protein
VAHIQWIVSPALMVTSLGANVNPTPTWTSVVAANNEQVIAKSENRKKKLFRREKNITPLKVLGNLFLLVYQLRCQKPDAGCHDKTIFTRRVDVYTLSWFIDYKFENSRSRVLANTLHQLSFSSTRFF